MLDRLKSIEAFVKSVESGSFAAAASLLDLSPQMIAKHVAALETQLGARLLNRTTRRQHLTELGRQYYERCRTILAEVGAADALVHEMRAEPQGKLRISAPTTFGVNSLMTFLTDFMRQHARIDIDLTLTDRYVDLIEEGFEAVFRIGTLADSRLISRRLAPYRLIVCAAPRYLSERGVPLIPEDLRQHECLGYAYRARQRDRAWTFQRAGQRVTVVVNSRLRVNDSRALMSAVLDGFGIMMGAEVMLRDAIARGQLIPLLQDYLAPARPLHLLYVADRQRTAKLSAFIDGATRVFGAGQERAGGGS